MLVYFKFVVKCDVLLGFPGTTIACALKLFRNSVALEKDPQQVNFIKMRVQGIWDCPDQDQEVGAKHIKEIEMFQMTSPKNLWNLSMKKLGY